MSGGKGGGGVDTPDFEELLKLQAGLNRINVNSPFGKVRFTQGNQGRRNLPRGVRSSTPTPGNNLPPGVTASFADGSPGGGGSSGGGGGGSGPAGGPGGGGGGGFGSTGIEELDRFLNPEQPATQTTSSFGGTGVPNTANITLSRDQQKILDLKEQGQKALGRFTRQQARGLRDLPGFTTDFSGDRTKVEDALFQRGTRLLNPQFENQSEAIEQRLADRGLGSGGEAFDEAFRSFNTGRDQALLDLSDRSILAGGQEQSRQLANLLAQRGQAFNEVLGGLSGQQIQSPTIFPPGAVDVTGPQSLVQGAQGINSQIGASNFQSTLGGLFGLGSAGLLGAFL